MEDILTSNVFGALRICNAHDHLLAFLRQARTLSGQFLLGGAGKIADVEYAFWPPCHESDDAYFAEPDLELRITLDDGSRHKVFVEAKYRSGKSSFDDDDDDEDGESNEDCAPDEIVVLPKSNDQLAKQWAHLIRSVGDKDWHPALIFLTADMVAPAADIAESRAAFEKIRKQVGRDFECYWLSWRHLGSVVAGSMTPLGMDLRAMLAKLDLKFFAGFAPVQSRMSEWTFAADAATADRIDVPRFAGFSSVSSCSASWQFGPGLTFNFGGYTAASFSWRFGR